MKNEHQNLRDAAKVFLGRKCVFCMPTEKKKKGSKFSKLNMYVMKLENN